MSVNASADNAQYILGQRIDYTTYDAASRQICELSQSDAGGYICVSTVHMVMEGLDNSEYRSMVNAANLITADGMPLVWWLKLRGVDVAERVHGPTLTPIVCKLAAEKGIAVGFYGATNISLEKLQRNLKAKFPDLNIAYTFSPPFRPLSEDEESKIISEILESGLQILFVSLGCPKQERWMATHVDRLPIAMVGVGAAFDLIAGLMPTAPSWMQRSGLEWLFRLMLEPRRLWKRYLFLNSRFIYHIIFHVLGLRKNGTADDAK